MNFLAHIYLSGDEDLIKIGNFIADGIRGKDYLEYQKPIQTGILLHRAIDTFTDAHPIFRQSTKRLHEFYGHYSGVIVDIFYDHFLAKYWQRYSNTSLDIYVDDFYTSLEQHFDSLPLHIQKFMPHMISGNWLVSYATIEGISKVLDGMNKRTKNKSKMNLAVKQLVELNDEFEEDFTRFFEELIVFSNNKLAELKNAQ